MFLKNKETEMYEKKIIGFNKKIHTKLAFLAQQKTDTTAQLYCTISIYVTPTPISCQNQKNLHNTTTVWYSKYIRSMYNQNLFPARTKNCHNSTTGKKVPPAHA